MVAARQRYTIEIDLAMNYRQGKQSHCTTAVAKSIRWCQIRPDLLEILPNCQGVSQGLPILFMKPTRDIPLSPKSRESRC